MVMQEIAKSIGGVAVGTTAKVSERGIWHDKWIFHKFASEKDYLDNNPYEVSEIDKGNLLLNSGINEIWKLVCGTGTAFSAANMRLGIGDGTTAAAATQTDLVGANKYYATVVENYPQVGANQKVVVRAAVGADDANFDWREFVIKNNSSGICLNRLVSNQGTKAYGQIWTVTLEITLS